MLIQIDEEIYSQILQVVKLKDATLYNQLQNIKTVDAVANARSIKTQRVKERIKSALIEILQTKEQPTRYKVHKQTSITYSTLKKYYDDIFDEVQLER